MTFTLKAGREKWDREQVREFLPEFTALREAMAERGEYPYNDSFLGRIPGIAGDCEGTAIYLLQTLYDIERERREIEALDAEGYRPIDLLMETTKYAHVVVHQPDYYVGGTGRIDRFEQARVVPKDGRPCAILPKGRRRNGLAIRCKGSRVYVR